MFGERTVRKEENGMGGWALVSRSLPITLVCFWWIVLSAHAATSVNEVIDAQGNVSKQVVSLTTDTHWGIEGSPYVIDDLFVVGESATLTMDPGVTVQVASQFLIQVFGTMTAEGVTFEGVNGGPWRGIYFAPRASASVVEDCVIRHSAQDLGLFNKFLRRTAIYLNGCSPIIRGNEIQVVDGHGIETFLSEALIEGNSIEIASSTHHAIFVNTLNLLPKMADNAASGDGILGVGVPGGGIIQSGRWTAPGKDLPYIIGGGLVLGADVQLVIEAGTVIQMPLFGWRLLGTLLVEGTEEAPVKFLGPWLGFSFAPGATKSVLRHCEIHDAGADFLGLIDKAWRKAAVYIGGASPTLDHVLIERSGGNGLELQAASPQLTWLTIRGSAWHGVSARVGSRPILQTLNLVENGTEGYYTVSLDATSLPQVRAVNFLNNSQQGIEVIGGIIPEETVWPTWGERSPYVLTHDLTLVSGASLTLEPGVVIKVAEGRFLLDGVLTSVGDEGNPVVVTSVKDDSIAGDTNGDGGETIPAPGDWKGIYLGPDATDTRIQLTEFRYAGGEHLGDLHKSLRQTAIYVNASHPTIENNRFFRSAGSGIELWGSQATVVSNRFEDVAEGRYPILFHALNTFPTLGNNEATGDGNLGVYVPPGKFPQSGVWSQPGAGLPYYSEGDLWVPQGLALTLSEGVQVEGAGLRFLIGGTLVCAGSALEPVVLSGRMEGGEVRPWRGIYYSPTAGDSRMSYTILRNAGGEELGVFTRAPRRTAIYVEGSSPSFRQVTILNSGANGIELASSGSRIVSSLIAENRGGAVMVRGGGVPPTILHSTIANNAGDGLVLEGASAVFDSNVVAFNQGHGIAGSLAALGEVEGMNHNLVFGNEGGDAPEWLLSDPATDELLNRNIIADPLFVNSAATNFRLKEGSPAIDAGGVGFVEPFDTDLDGRIRSHGEKADIGAYEFGAAGLRYAVDLATRRQGETDWNAVGSEDGSAQRFVAAVPPEQESVYELRVLNSGNQPDALTLKRGALSAEWDYRVLIPGDAPEDITMGLFGPEGYRWPELLPGEERIIEIRFNPGSGEGDSQILRTSFQLSSSNGGADELLWEAAVVSLPQILTQPEGQSITEGDALALKVGVGGPGFVRYEWFKDGLPIEGANRSDLLIPWTRALDAGLYWVDVIGVSGRVRSSVVEVLVASRPPVLPLSLSLRRKNDSLLLTWEGGEAPFTVLAKESLEDERWMPLAEDLEGREFTLSPGSSSMFFMVSYPKFGGLLE